MTSTRASLRGQAFAVDAFLSILVLCFTLVLFLNAQAMVEQQRVLNTQTAGLEAASQDAARVLMTTGIPESWSGVGVNPSTIHSVGLLDSSGKLDQAKVDAFFSLAVTNHEKARELLGLYRQGTSYDFELMVSGVDGGNARRTQTLAKKDNALTLTRVARDADGNLQQVTILVAEK